ncbi:MAG: D-2-hydroxyacid dehydrogenase [Pseudomonadales bacterium]
MRGVILDAATLGDAELGAILDNGDDWQVFPDTAPGDVPERIVNAEIVLTNKAPVTAAAIKGAKHLQLISIMATGTNNIDLDAARERQVTVCNVRGYGSASVAQHTLGLMLNLATNMPGYFSDTQQGAWQKRGQATLLHRPIFELAGKRLGIVGYGELGQAVAKLAVAFGMEVKLCQHKQLHDQQNQFAVLTLDELLPEIDFLTLHCPLTPDSEKMINANTLGLMPKGSYLINTARGALIDNAALLDALQSGQLAGAALDVLPIEPPADDDQLLSAGMPNLLITPHNAWGAKESRQRLIAQVSDIIKHFHKNQPFNVVS